MVNSIQMKTISAFIVMVAISGILLMASRYFILGPTISKICKQIDMRAVKVTTYTNKEGVIGGYFARTTDMKYMHAPSFLFDAKGENRIIDSFFSKSEDREAFRASIESMLKNFPIETESMCSK